MTRLRIIFPSFSFFLLLFFLRFASRRNEKRNELERASGGRWKVEDRSTSRRFSIDKREEGGDGRGLGIGEGFPF